MMDYDGGKVEHDDFEKFKSNFEDYLTEKVWISSNGRILEYSQPTLGIQLTPEHFFDTIKKLYKTYKNIYRVSIMLSYILKNETTENFELFYASANTSIMEPEYLYINKNDISGSFNDIRHKLSQAESENFMTSTTNRYAKQSKTTKAIPCLIVYKCLLYKN